MNNDTPPAWLVPDSRIYRGFYICENSESANFTAKTISEETGQDVHPIKLYAVSTEKTHELADAIIQAVDNLGSEADFVKLRQTIVNVLNNKML